MRRPKEKINWKEANWTFVIAWLLILLTTATLAYLAVTEIPKPWN